jgi:tetratricopeptide (TPR) repeat protein
MSMDATLSRHMTMEPESRAKRRRMAAIIPWAVAAAGLILYGLTMHRWVSLASVPHVAKLSGWSWHMELTSPLYWLLTFPMRWLPPAQIPLVLNLFAVICGAATLGLLARSVMLLPHDRTIAQRERERSEFALLSIPTAWVPPILAVIVCGLQLSFWEHATAARSVPFSTSAQILDLLVFAYVIRCLLEYRITDRDSWLFKAAFVYGLGMTNDWSMIGYLPAFFVALLWIKGVAFFNGQFLVKLLSWGFIGLLLYLLLPIVQSTSDIHRLGFWDCFRTNVGEQFYPLKAFWIVHQTILVLSFTSLVPVFLMGIRWTSYFGDTSHTGAVAARLVFHLVHALFFFACIWMAFDPPVSPRNQPLPFVGQDRVVAFLSFYYLGALAVGYLSGYFLLLFSPKRSSRSVRQQGRSPIGTVAMFAVISLVVIVPAGLLALNLPKIRIANSPLVKQYASLLAQNLPQKPAVILSDDARKLILLQEWFAGKPEEKTLLFVDTSSLQAPEYHTYLKKRYPGRWDWNVAKPTELVPDAKLLELAYNLSLTNELHYLHPSFGYYFELFYAEPHGLTSRLRLYPNNSMLRPALAQDVIEQNQAFWKKLDKFPTLAAHIAGPVGDPSVMQRIWNKLRLSHKINPEARILASYYSQSLNAWGTQLQRHDMFEEAAPMFAMAHELSPDNLVAEVNLGFNERYRAGKKGSIPLGRRVEDEFGKYRSWTGVIEANGPFDEPGFCYNLGLAFAKGKNFRQAAQNFDRSTVLGPDNLAAYLWLGEMYIRGAQVDEALKLVEKIYSTPQLLNQETNRAELIMVEASAYATKTNFSGAASAATRGLKRWPKDQAVIGAALQVYLSSGSYTNALSLVDEMLRQDPDNPAFLINKGFVCIQLSKFQDAIAPLTRVLNLATNDQATLDNARFNRAVANLRSGKLDDAQADYEALRQLYTNSFQVHYGLAEIAYQRKDVKNAVLHYQQYLTNSPTDSPETIDGVRAKLEQLKQGAL